MSGAPANAGTNSASPEPKSARGRINSALAALLIRAEQHKKVFFSFYLPAEASAQAGKKKSGARKIRIATKKSDNSLYPVRSKMPRGLPQV
ncbi:MAG: hypothetical protein A3H02_02890 [Candidatus Niyogibacteria bacterium RIFCSPLOWO2_12_FULL_41_13]|uniref:Uncharacterized protein n=2 Tax=Parcubacteria group TaxID=1794811 RepID=A0A1G1Z445_9BACT|nr:MAG: hypothetical protein A3F24_00835 [Candidatus Colwellbacteria bacterium RIFCSPHIGHO2_12_FULL_44_17]OGZ32025.1 MAG: hypothetical protein A3H02_02890 [Candidatus Niyogibacteria bacterium RIFCSPLOWO2_12_FULL_41_13]